MMRPGSLTSVPPSGSCSITVPSGWLLSTGLAATVNPSDIRYLRASVSCWPTTSGTSWPLLPLETMSTIGWSEPTSVPAGGMVPITEPAWTRRSDWRLTWAATSKPRCSSSALAAASLERTR